MQRKFYSNLILMVFLNLLVKPIAIFGIDATVQNRVGPEEYGIYFSLLNFTFLFNILLDFGINNFTTKNIAQYPKIIPGYLGKILFLRVVLFVVYCVITLVVAFFMKYDSRAFSLLYLLILNQFLITLIAYIRSHFAGVLNFKIDALLSVLDRTILILLGGTFLFTSVFGQEITIEWFVLLQTIAYGVTTLVGTTLLLKRFGIPKIKWQKNFSLVILRKSVPYALLILLMMLYTRTDSVMLERIHKNGSYEAGIYAQGFRLLDAFWMFGMLFSNLLFPLFSSMIIQKSSELQKLILSSSKLLIGGAMFVALICFFNAQTLLSWIYTSNIDESSEPFIILMFTFVAMCSTLIFGTFMTANGSLKQLNRIAFIGLIINVGLNLAVIPTYGAMGASLATLVTQGVVAIIQVFLVHKTLQFDFSFMRIARFLLYIIVLVIGLYLMDNFKINIAVQIGYGIFAIVAFRILNLREIKQIIAVK